MVAPLCKNTSTCLLTYCACISHASVENNSITMTVLSWSYAGILYSKKVWWQQTN